MRFIYIVPDLHVAIENTKPLFGVRVTQECVPFALLSGYKVFRAAVNNMDVLWASCEVPDIFVQF